MAKPRAQSEATSANQINAAVECGVLEAALTHIQGVVERRNTIPILGNLLIEATPTELRLTATDMDIDMVESIPAKVKITGSTTVPALTLYEITRKLPKNAEVLLDNSDSAERMVIKSGRSRFVLGTLPTEDFPLTATGELAVQFSLPVNEARRLIDRSRFAMSSEETRYYLNGIYMHAATIDGVAVLRAVATDGHRLARVEMPLPSGAAAMPGIIIPRKTINEVRKLLDEAREPLIIETSTTRIRFKIGGVILTSKLIDGAFPDYERVIPSNNTKMLEANVKDFAAAVDRVATIALEKSRAVKLHIAKNTVQISATSTDAANASDEVEARYNSEAVDIGFNARYLLEITSHIEGDTVRFMLADATAPAIVQDPGDISALYVLMPMRV